MLCTIACLEKPSTSPETERTTATDLGVYTIGLAIAVAVMATSFWAANTFLSTSSFSPSPTWEFVLSSSYILLHTKSALALAFGVILVVVGSVWITTGMRT